MKKLLYILALLPIVLVSCSKFLDMVPEDDIETIETIFEREEKAIGWFKDCYVPLNMMLCDWNANVSLMASDEFAVAEVMHTTNRFGGIRMVTGYDSKGSPIDNLWHYGAFYGAIRKINTFLNRVDGVYDMLDEDKEMMKGEIKALKAHYYYELLRRYGPIVLMDQNMEVTLTDDEMRLPRSSVDEVVAEICRLVDDARPQLQKLYTKNVSRGCYHSLEAAMMLKAKALFLAASPIFNGNISYNDFKSYEGKQLVSPSYDNEKWVKAAEAIEEAIKVVVDEGGMHLYESTQNVIGTEFRTTMYDVERSVLAPGYKNPEAVYYVRPAQPNYGQISLLDGEIDHTLYNSQHLGVVAASMKMVETYYTENGLPLDMDPDWIGSGEARYKMGILINKTKYQGVVPEAVDVLNLHLDREPRFYAHIAADRTYWRRGTEVEDNVLVEAYRGERFGSSYTTIGSSNMQNTTGYWIKKHLDSDHSTKTYLADASKEEYGTMVMRVAELYLMLAEALNESQDAPTQEVYDAINMVRSRAGIPNVEVSWSQFSINPTYHTTKSGMRSIIRQEWDIEFAFEGMRFWNTRRWLTAASEINKPIYGWNILGTNADQFYNNGNGPVPVWNKNVFYEDRGYLHPISDESIFKSGVTQNPGW